MTLISADSGEARKAAIRGVSYAPEWDPRTYLWATFAVAVAAVRVRLAQRHRAGGVAVAALPDRRAGDCHALRIMAIDLRQLRQFPRVQFLPDRADLFVRDRGQEHLPDARSLSSRGDCYRQSRRQASRPGVRPARHRQAHRQSLRIQPQDRFRGLARRRRLGGRAPRRIDAAVRLAGADARSGKGADDRRRLSTGGSARSRATGARPNGPGSMASRPGGAHRRCLPRPGCSCR